MNTEKQIIRIWNPHNDTRPGLSENLVLGAIKVFKGRKFNGGRKEFNLLVTSSKEDPEKSSDCTLFEFNKERNVVNNFASFYEVRTRTRCDLIEDIISNGVIKSPQLLKFTDNVDLVDLNESLSKDWIDRDFLHEVIDGSFKNHIYLDEKNRFIGAPKNARIFRLGETLTPEEVDSLGRLHSSISIGLVNNVFSTAQANNLYRQEKLKLLKGFSIGQPSRENSIQKLGLK